VRSFGFLDAMEPVYASREAAPGPIAGPSSGLKFYGAGFNAFCQISGDPNIGGIERKDVFSFTRLFTISDTRLLCSGWSTTALVDNSEISQRGSQRGNQRLSTATAKTLHSGFGDHNGLRGCLSTSGDLYVNANVWSPLVKQGDDGSPKLGLIAVAGNGKVAITFEQAPNGRLCHVLQFDEVNKFITWHNDPSKVQLDAEKQHVMLPGRPVQLVAGTGTFLLLMEDGDVHSWGDPRYLSLGRAISESPAEKPGRVDALAGLKIEKIVAGGWMNAALSSDRAGYIWGTGMPGTENTIKLLKDAEAGDVVLIEIPDENIEPLDILDVAVGDNHIAVVVEGQRLFVAGHNRNGQLGLSEGSAEFMDQWQEVPGVRGVQHVVCGPKATFIFAQ
jgi:hypothetical protein